MLALEQGQLEVAEFLLQKGADAYTEDYQHYQVYDYAVDSGYPDALLLIDKYAPE